MSSTNRLKILTNRNKKKTIFISVILLILLIVTLSDYGLLKRFSLELQLKEQKEIINANNQITDSLQKILYQLQKDSLEIERMAREKYGLTKENEEVFFVKRK